MDVVYVIPNDLVFSPCKVDGLFWVNFHTIISYLGNAEELVRLKNEEPDRFNEIIEPLIRFVSETEAELHSKGYMKEVSLEKEDKS